jgi:hypothetical protein
VNATPPLRLLSRDALDTLPDPHWLIDGILPLEGSTVMFGPSGVGKTFLALDMASSICTGSEWHNRAVIAGPVVYMTAEGLGGLKLRIRAWETIHRQKATDFWVIPDAPQFARAIDQTRLLQTLSALPKWPVLVIVDTFARHFVGLNENLASDVGLFIGSLDVIRRDYKCATLLIHHSGKAADLERGSTALRASADTMISVTREKKKSIAMHCDKQKESDPFPELFFRLTAVDLDRNGCATSCVVESEVNDEAPAPREATKNGKAILSAFSDRPNADLRHGELMDLALRRGVPRGSFDRELKALIAQGSISKTSAGLYRMTADAVTQCNGIADPSVMEEIEKALTPSHPFRGDGDARLIYDAEPQK